MKSFALAASAALLLAVSGCGTAPSPLTKSAVTAAVSAATLIGATDYPQTVPDLRAAETVICAAANQTNVQPDYIVSALQAAGITNAYSKIIVNGIVAVYDGVFQSYGSGWMTNQPALQGYLGATCQGMQQGLPPPAPGPRRARREVPPHIK